MNGLENHSNTEKTLLPGQHTLFVAFQPTSSGWYQSKYDIVGWLNTYIFMTSSFCLLPPSRYSLLQLQILFVYKVDMFFAITRSFLSVQATIGSDETKYNSKSHNIRNKMLIFKQAILMSLRLKWCWIQILSQRN